MNIPNRGGSYTRVDGELVLVTPPTGERDCKCQEEKVAEVPAAPEQLVIPDDFDLELSIPEEE